MLELRIYELATFPPALDWQASTFVGVEWPQIGDGLGGRMYGAKPDALRVVLVDGDILHSYAAVVRFRLPHGGQDHDARGLTSVCTFPTSRQKGYESQVVAAATEAIRSSGVDLGLLLTHAGLHRFYARSGWEAITSAPTLGPAKEQAQEIHAYRVMLFLSAKGQAGRRAFETEPLYIERGWGV